MTKNSVHPEQGWFKDEQGRTLILRGVNLGGSSKVPVRPNGASHLREGFFDHRTVSFVGRPFPLAEADEHFARLKHWGVNILRFIVTWEAVEHSGPGDYDQEYLEYVHEIAQKANHYDIALFIDPHQDVWSRFSGGCGAPGWTFDAVGMDITRFAETGSALVHCIHGDPFPRMIWPSNFTKLACATMFSLFFGGNDFAPETKVDGQPVQDYLQEHYIQAVRQVALAVKDLPNVIGYDIMNEPASGWIGWSDLTSSGDPHSVEHVGEMPSPLQSMALGAGIPQRINVWEHLITGDRLLEHRLVNPNKTRVWKDGYECVWKQNGVWDVDSQGQPILLRPDHFTKVGDRPVDFLNDHLLPFTRSYAAALQTVSPDPIIFFEYGWGRMPPDLQADPGLNLVNSCHWYDGYNLYSKEYPDRTLDYRTGQLIEGLENVQEFYLGELGRIKKLTQQQMGNLPILIGEFGIPFDMDGKEAYRSGDFSHQVAGLNLYLHALDNLLLSGTLWDYCGDNDNERGDLWNGEDLSVFSRDQQTDPKNIYSGGRALQAFIRPYARKTAGEPLEMNFDIRNKIFEFRFKSDPAIQAATEIFVPQYHYPGGYNVEISDGEYKKDPAKQVLTFYPEIGTQIHSLRITPQA